MTWGFLFGRRVVSATSRIETCGATTRVSADLARSTGLPRGYDIGSQRISWVAHLLTDWAGDAGELIELEVRLRRPNLMGDTTWLRGEVTGRERTATGAFVTCAVEGVNQRGEVTTSATATVALPSR